MPCIINGLIVSLFLTGCASFTSPARMHELDASKSYWFDYDVTRRGAVLFVNSTNWNTCAEPAPDVAIGVVAKLEGDLRSAGQGEAAGKVELTQSIVKLAERTQMVLFLRESLFRLCELSANRHLPASEAKDLYIKIIDAALALVQKERAEIELDKARVESANKALSIYQFLNERGVDKSITEDFLKKF